MKKIHPIIYAATLIIQGKKSTSTSNIITFPHRVSFRLLNILKYYFMDTARAQNTSSFGIVNPLTCVPHSRLKIRQNHCIFKLSPVMLGN